MRSLTPPQAAGNALAIAVQKVMIEMSPWLSVCVLCTIGLVLLMPSIWMSGRRRYVLQDCGKKLLLAAVVVRFAFPAVAYLTDYAHASFLSAHHEEASGNIGREFAVFAGEESPATKMEESAGAENKGLWDKVKQGVEKGAQMVVEPGRAVWDLKEKVEQLKDKASGFIENFIRLAAYFILNTILLPVGFLWGVVKAGRFFLGSGFLHGIEGRVRPKLESSKKRERSGLKKGRGKGLGDQPTGSPGI